MKPSHGPTHAISDSEPEDEPPQVPTQANTSHDNTSHGQTPRTREEFIKQALENQGFEEGVIPFVTKPQRDSSCSVYDSHWNQFVKFCDTKQWDPRLTNPQRMCEYIVHLFNQGKAVNSLENTHSGLRSVLRHYGYPEDLPVLVKDCFSSLWKARPRERKICTEWDINHVLNSFLKHPYINEDGDDSDICLRQLTIKTAFLTALACSRRKSEIHAFSRAKRLLRSETKASGEVILTLNTSPGFVAKNQKARDLYPEINLRSIFHEYPDDPQGALLCPVRAITRYVERTKDWDNPKSLLFVNPERGKNITASSLSCWLKAAISEAYSNDEASPHCTPHEIRAVSTSLSVFNHASVADILDAGTWRHFSTFTENYLRDVTPSMVDGRPVYRLPNFVAAGNRIANSL